MLFSSKFANEVLLPIAVNCYRTDSRDAINPPLPLYSGYKVVGPITAGIPAATIAADTLIRRLIKNNGIFGLVVQNIEARVLVVAFRGTYDVSDFLHDLDVVPAEYDLIPGYDYGLVHQGTLSVYKAIRASVLSLLRSASGTDSFTRLIITGHSLGAGIAVLAAPDLLYNGRVNLDALEVQTFAGPRVGYQDFANNFDTQISSCFRVVNKWDIVPALPPPILFEHVGKPIHIDGGFTLDELVAHSMTKSYRPGLAGDKKNAAFFAPSAGVYQIGGVR
jgi:triacylglycerol lipase